METLNDEEIVGYHLLIDDIASKLEYKFGLNSNALIQSLQEIEKLLDSDKFLRSYGLLLLKGYIFDLDNSSYLKSKNDLSFILQMLMGAQDLTRSRQLSPYTFRADTVFQESAVKTVFGEEFVMPLHLDQNYLLFSITGKLEDFGLFFWSFNSLLGTIESSDFRLENISKGSIKGVYSYSISSLLNIRKVISKLKISIVKGIQSETGKEIKEEGFATVKGSIFRKGADHLKTLSEAKKNEQEARKTKLEADKLESKNQNEVDKIQLELQKIELENAKLNLELKRIEVFQKKLETIEQLSAATATNIMKLDKCSIVIPGVIIFHKNGNIFQLDGHTINENTTITADGEVVKN